MTTAPKPPVLHAKGGLRGRPPPDAAPRLRSKAVHVGIVGLLAFGAYSLASPDRNRCTRTNADGTATATSCSSSSGGHGGAFIGRGGGASAVSFGGFGATGHGFGGGGGE
jgi:hypothetical protein